VVKRINNAEGGNIKGQFACANMKRIFKCEAVSNLLNPRPPDIPKRFSDFILQEASRSHHSYIAGSHHQMAEAQFHTRYAKSYMSLAPFSFLFTLKMQRRPLSHLGIMPLFCIQVFKV